MASNNPLAEELNIQSLRISSPTHDASTNRPGRPVLSGADEAVKAYLLRESKSFASAHELRERVSYNSLQSQPHRTNAYLPTRDGIVPKATNSTSRSVNVS